jgi:hypothetical protein
VHNRGGFRLCLCNGNARVQSRHDSALRQMKRDKDVAVANTQSKVGGHHTQDRVFLSADSQTLTDDLRIARNTPPVVIAEQHNLGRGGLLVFRCEDTPEFSLDA